MNVLVGPQKHTVIQFDVTDFKAARSLLKKVVQIYKRPPNILVNCAGIVSFTPLLEETPETFQRIIDVNLKVNQKYFC